MARANRSDGPPPLIDDTIQRSVLKNNAANKRPPFPTSLQAGASGARYTCETLHDEGETSGDEDVMASTIVTSPPEEDDGWESGEDLTACEREGRKKKKGERGRGGGWVDYTWFNFAFSKLHTASRLAAFVDNGALVDEVKSLYATTQDKDSLRKALSPLLRGMFSDHPDPYGLLVTFLKKGGKMQYTATLALPRVALAEFRQWLEGQNGLKEMVCSGVLVCLLEH